MRKAAGVFIACSLLIPVGVLATGSAGGAATATTQCKALTGKQTYTPALPIITSKTVVTSKVASTSKLTGCVGGGVTGGTAVAKSTYKGNCASFAKNFKTPTKGTATITWNTGKTSTVATTLTALTAAGTSPALVKLVSKFTAGLFVGHTSTVTISAVGNAGKNTCITAGLSFFTFQNKGPFKNT